jgi:hypothetical protein
MLLPALAWAQPEVNAYAGLKLNEIQLIGSHNSYKPGIEPQLWNIIYAKDSARANALEYGHISLTGQLELGLRNLELDVVHDPKGGRYANPMGLQLIKQAGGIPDPFDTSGDLDKPGLKVFHVPDVDFRSHHLLFVDCLRELHEWSKRHPGHIPVIITINAKDGEEKGLAKLLPFTHDALDSIDLEIKSVFSEKELVTPDLVRGNHARLDEAVLTEGWPPLNRLAGRFMFVLDETGEKLKAYKNGHPGLNGKLLFVNETEGSAEAAFMIINNPMVDGEKIKSLVQKGYMVRTRADANTVQARNNDYSMFKAAMQSGAQVITTDYYLPSRLFPSSYKVIFDGGSYMRKNPVTAMDK